MTSKNAVLKMYDTTNCQYWMVRSGRMYFWYSNPSFISKLEEAASVIESVAE